MSSATSIDDAGRGKGDSERARPGTFNVWHLFVLMSLLAASVAVLVARQNSPENLLLLSLTIGAAGAAGFGLYRVLAPFASSEVDLIGQPLSDRLRADLEREKMLALRSIKELEFDRAMGKVSNQDFDEMSSRLRARAMGLMLQLDEGRSPYRDAIERELQSRIASDRDAKQPGTQPIAPPPSGLTCVCGTTNDVDARFCKSCGSRLVAERQA